MLRGLGYVGCQKVYLPSDQPVNEERQGGATKNLDREALAIASPLCLARKPDADEIRALWGG